MIIPPDNKELQRFFYNDLQEEEDKANEKLLRLLDKTLSQYTITNNTLYLVYNSGVKCYIEKRDFDENSIYISDESYYLDSDNANSKISLDRVICYVGYIANSEYSNR